MKFLKNNLLLTFILIISAFLRLWNLTSYPSGFNADEAAIGYNAYSILKTGKDEYGEILPLIFKSFGDYKPGLYFYIVVPFVAVLGLNELAVRIPSALFGIATVIIIYLMTLEIFKEKKVAYTAALFLAILPWHIHFSRGGWESNVATFFISLGVLFFLKGLNNFKYMLYSFISFLISMYLYQSPRLIIPVFIFILLIVYRKYFLRFKKKFIIYSIFCLILAIPLIFQFLSGSGNARFSGLSFLSDPGPKSRVDELRGHHQSLDSPYAKFFHNKLTAYLPSFLGHYLDHFDSQFLFIRGEEVIRNKIPETGQFYIIQALFLIIGLLTLINFKESKNVKLILIWILISPLASAMTFQTPNALRSLNMVIPLCIIMAYGFWQISRIKFKTLKLAFFSLVTIFLSFEFIHYLESYYIHYPKRYPLAWEYGFREMIKKLDKYEGSFEKVVITDRYDQPYILVLFYKQYEPLKYQPQAKLTERDKFNFGTVRGFDKYEFRQINKEELSYSQNTLFIGTEKEIPSDAEIIDKVIFPNGKDAFIFTKT